MEFLGMEQNVFFEDIELGMRLPVREFGPHTLVNGIRWAGIQEHPSPTHTDRDYVRQHRGLRTFIASGAHREAYLARTLMDWVGPRGDLRKMAVRHTASTFEGDLLRFSGTVVEKSPSPDDPWITFELDAKNQNGEDIMRGQFTLIVPSRQAGRSS
jgi:acyl dehydratase